MCKHLKRHLSDYCMIRTVRFVNTTSNFVGTKQQTYKCAEVIPDFGDVWVQPDGTGVCIKRISVLIDLVVEDSDGTPEGRVAAITIDRLLVGFICLRVLLL